MVNWFTGSGHKIKSGVFLPVATSNPPFYWKHGKKTILSLLFLIIESEYLFVSQVYHSTFIDEEGIMKACGCPLLPLKSHIRGPAPVSDQGQNFLYLLIVNSKILIKEILYIFKKSHKRTCSGIQQLLNILLIYVLKEI